MWLITALLISLAFTLTLREIKLNKIEIEKLK